MDLGEVARRILSGPLPGDKLLAFDVGALAPPAVEQLPEPRPGRAPALRMVHAPERLPRPGDLGSPSARGECLHRFANHELQAVELFAWAALTFTDAPWAFRVGLMRTLRDEQAHLRAYLGRMEAHGVALGDLPLSGNFWTHADKLRDPLVFLCAMGLTFEQANLDHALVYRDGFARAGAGEDATVMQQVHDDEVGHVGFALSWVRRFKDPALTELDAYRAAIPFPLGLHRAKARAFHVGSRQQAGLPEEFIAAARAARSPQQQNPRRSA